MNLRRESTEVEPPYEYLSPEKATALFNRSFMISRGSAPLQQEIFEWLHLQYPHYKITEEVKQKMATAVKQTLMGQMSQGLHEAIETQKIIDIDILAEMMFQALNKQRFSDEAIIIAEILERIVERDIKFFVNAEGGVVHKKPAYSQIVENGFLAKTTKIPEYDEMFSKLGNLAREWVQRRIEKYTDVMQVIEFYKKTADSNFSL